MEAAIVLKNGSASASMEPMALGILDPPKVSVTCEITVLRDVSELKYGKVRMIPHDIERHRLALQISKSCIVC